MGAAVVPGPAVAAGAMVGAGADVAVADEPQATMNTKRMDMRTEGFLSRERLITLPPDDGTLSTIQVANVTIIDEPCDLMTIKTPVIRPLAGPPRNLCRPTIINQNRGIEEPQGDRCR